MQKKAIIIGAGPAGLTAAYELLKRTDIIPIVIEKDRQVGGISKTVDYKGNKMDFGPHRFFSKSDRVMNWWTNIMPLHTPKGEDLTISYQNKSRTINTGDFLTAEDSEGLPPEKSMLVIPRLTRIYFLRKFFEYPIKLSIATLGQLGIWTTIKIVFSYLYARLFPRKPQNSLEDFMINKFGSVLYHIFFKDYTEKVWGIDCKDIPADWGAQRIKGVSLSKAIIHAAKALTKKKKADINQKDTETSLIEQFLYPAKGAGAMWEEVARQVEVLGGKIIHHYDVKNIQVKGGQITGVEALNTHTGKLENLEGDYFISTMPVQELITGMGEVVPQNVQEVAAGLMYRDFVYAGVLVRKMAIETPKDSWIYIQERDVKVARMQVYNNWGPYMVADPDTVWLGLEYFCTKGDAIWNLTDQEVEQLAVEELIKMDLIHIEDVLDSKVNRMEKTYPAYFGTYDRFEEIRAYLDQIPNLFLVGRNGMHKYNNTDHSMLTAMVAVDNICEGVTSKTNLWEINTEQEYHEVKKEHHKDGSSTAPKTVPSLSVGFREYVFQENKRLLWFALIASAIQWLVLKYFFPFANYIHGDSFVYIRAAAENADINTHMIGYSRFLRLVSVFTDSDTALVSLQYLFIQSSGLALLFTLFHFYSFTKIERNILLLFFVINPLSLYMANLVSSDSIFTSISVIWITSLIWIINKPNRYSFVIHAVSIFIAFSFRYNALVYPFISAIAIFTAKISLVKKVTVTAIPVIMCALFIIYTGNNFKRFTGIWQYSPFSGWQLANNAMYTYRYVDSAGRKDVPKKFKALDNAIRKHFDSTRNFVKYPSEGIKAGTFYMWTPHLPLFRYRDSLLKTDSTVGGDLKAWATIAPFYGEYGRYIIRQYPKEYLQHFVWPNFLKYYAPGEEFLEVYNSGYDSINPMAANWFEQGTTKVFTRTKEKRSLLLSIYPIFSGAVNVTLFCTLLTFVITGAYKSFRGYRKLLVVLISFWLVNALFTTISSPAALRLQALAFSLEFITTVVLVSLLLRYDPKSVPSADKKPFWNSSLKRYSVGEKIAHD